MDEFEIRKDTAKAMLAKFLRRYEPPTGIEPEGLQDTVQGISEALAKRIAGPDFEGRVRKTFDAVADSHKSMRWPAQGVFVACIPEVKEIPEEVRLKADASAITSGKAYLCTQITGATARALIQSGKVTEAQCKAVGVL